MLQISKLNKEGNSGSEIVDEILKMKQIKVVATKITNYPNYEYNLVIYVNKSSVPRKRKYFKIVNKEELDEVMLQIRKLEKEGKNAHEIVNETRKELKTRKKK